MQLDIFERSRDVMLRNDIVHALERRDVMPKVHDRPAPDYPAG